jgi:hypothetical protein
MRSTPLPAWLHIHVEYRTLDPAFAHRSVYRRPSSHPPLSCYQHCLYTAAHLLQPLHRLRNLDQMRQPVIKYIHASNVWRASDWGGVLLLRGRGSHALILRAQHQGTLYVCNIRQAKLRCTSNFGLTGVICDRVHAYGR